MKSAWYGFVGFALLNFLLVVGGLAFLAVSGRIDRVRVDTLIELISETTAERDARLEQAQVEQQLAAEAEIEAVKLAEPPLTAEQWTERKLESDEVLQERAERLKREVGDLRRSLATERTELDADRSEFEREKSDFAKMRRRLREAEEDDRFQVALETLASVPTKTAASMLLEVEQVSGRDQVVSYLDGLELRQRGKVVAEIEKGDAALAADLLERLRTRGLQTAAATTTPTAMESPGG